MLVADSYPVDCLDRAALAGRSTAPAVRAILTAEARGYVQLRRGAVHFVATSATGTPERVRDVVAALRDAEHRRQGRALAAEAVAQWRAGSKP